MAWLSIGLGVLSLVCMGLGVLFTPFPVLGAAFAFSAPLLAIAGIVTGGLALSRARNTRSGRSSGPPHSGAAPLTGVIVSSIALLPALLTALTCGVCNALFSTAHIQSGGGAWRAPWPPPGPAGDGDTLPRRDDAERDAGVNDDAPPPAFPAPPLPGQPGSQDEAPHAPDRHRH